MRCRRIKKIDGRNEVVWFGSWGKNGDRTQFFSPTDKHDNFSDQQQGVSDSLTQRLSVLREELWYDIDYGLPLFDKVRKPAMDSFICSTVLNHPDVVSIDEFSSQVINNKYSCSMTVVSVFGNVLLSI